MKKTCAHILLCLILVLNFILPGCSAFNQIGDISEYVIVTAQNPTEYEQRAAEYIHDAILKRTGKEIPVSDDSAKQTDHEILIGQTNRPLSSQTRKTETEGLQFVINAKKGSIALQGDYFIIAAAAYHFVNEYVSETGLSNSIPKKPTVFSPAPQKAKNYFLLIGDGMGEYQTKLIEYFGKDNDIYQKNNDNEDFFYGYLLPNQGTVSTYSLSGTTDSAAAGTALACGYKTYNKSIGIDGQGCSVKSLTELAVELGFLTAVMSTDVATGATPAAFSAHAHDRTDIKTISKSQLQMTKTDIICTLGNKNVEQINAIVKQELVDLKNDTGSFLMYEEAYIDKHSHKNDLNKTYSTVLRFNKIIGTVMEFAMYNPDTMVIITADHETGGLKPNANGELTYTTANHTSAFVPVFAYGQDTEYFNDSTVKNIDIPKFIAGMWGIADFGE